MIRKHSVTLRGHRTSFSLEDAFWTEINYIAKTENTTLAALLTGIDENRPPATNLSSAIRLFVLDYFKGRSPRTQDLDRTVS